MSQTTPILNHAFFQQLHIKPDMYLSNSIIATFLPVGDPKVWSEIGVLALDPNLLSQSISSDLEAGPTLAQPHSSISKVQSPDKPAAVCGAP